MNKTPIHRSILTVLLTLFSSLLMATTTDYFTCIYTENPNSKTETILPLNLTQPAAVPVFENKDLIVTAEGPYTSGEPPKDDDDKALLVEQRLKANEIPGYSCHFDALVSQLARKPLPTIPGTPSENSVEYGKEFDKAVEESRFVLPVNNNYTFSMKVVPAKELLTILEQWSTEVVGLSDNLPPTSGASPVYMKTTAAMFILTPAVLLTTGHPYVAICSFGISLFHALHHVAATDTKKAQITTSNYIAGAIIKPIALAGFLALVAANYVENTIQKKDGLAQITYDNFVAQDGYGEYAGNDLMEMYFNVLHASLKELVQVSQVAVDTLKDQVQFIHTDPSFDSARRELYATASAGMAMILQQGPFLPLLALGNQALINYAVHSATGRPLSDNLLLNTCDEYYRWNENPAMHLCYYAKKAALDNGGYIVFGIWISKAVFWDALYKGGWKGVKWISWLVNRTNLKANTD